MEFNEALAQALAENNGTLTFEQAVNLLPPASQHQVMKKLGDARASGVISMRVEIDKTVTPRKASVVIESPQPTSQPVVGGSQ